MVEGVYELTGQAETRSEIAEEEEDVCFACWTASCCGDGISSVLCWEAKTCRSFRYWIPATMKTQA